MKFSIYRFDPDKDETPYMQSYDIVLEPADRMLLDALVAHQIGRRQPEPAPLLPRRSVRLGWDEH